MSTPNRNDWMTWKAFVDLVTGFLTVDADRAGLETYRTQMIRAGVGTIQRLFPEYRVGHETVYLPSDLVYDGKASKGVKPPESVAREFWLCKVQRDAPAVSGGVGNQTGKCRVHGLDPISWDDRKLLLNGTAPVNGGRGKVAIDPQGYQFYVYPAVYDDWLLSLIWDGVKLDFQDGDQTPFDEAMALAVSYFVKAHIAREVNQDEQSYESYMKSFAIDKAHLYVKKREEKELAAA